MKHYDNNYQIPKILEYQGEKAEEKYQKIEDFQKILTNLM